MSSRKRRIDLDHNWKQPSLWRRLFGRVHNELRVEPAVLGIDYTLRHRAALHAVRAFIERIDHYSLQSSRVVQVLSDYVVPDDSGLERKVPEWLAERLRFGVVTVESRVRYIPIQHVDFRWDRGGIEAQLYLSEKIAPGTRAFIAAYLGHGDGINEVDELPQAVVLEEQG
jgi:hypothetical protein